MANMVFEGRSFEMQIGSDVSGDNDGMYLECIENTAPFDLKLFAYRCDKTGKTTFTAYEEKLPFALVEAFVASVKEELLSDK